jgi:NAD(P)-dependent dehydrogenase (short-subunit alcohol dehydrogenase family)
MSGRLQDKVAIVVGAGQTPGAEIGNGRATALRFAEEGARVFLVDRDGESAEETLRLVRERGGEGVCFAADVSKEAACEAMIKACLDQYGRIDVLHNNVGIGKGDASITQITEEAWDRIYAVNLKSVVFACKHALPAMREQGSGVIVNISSLAAIAPAQIIAYKSSKAAVNALTQSLAIGNARFNIRVNAIMPGLMNTPMAIEGYVARGMEREKLIADRNAQVPLGAMGSAWDVANAALFLASDEAKFITGVCLPVDGGQSARVG